MDGRGKRTRYASAGRTAEARKPIAPTKARAAEWRPRLEMDVSIAVPADLAGNRA